MATTYNQDIAGVIRRLDRFVKEMTHAVSSGLSLTNEFDQSRLQSYLDAITQYRGFVVAQPQLDLPETSPFAFNLAEAPALPDAENESLVDVIQLLLVARGELLNSQSSRMGAGLMNHDDKRFMALIEKTGRLLTDYIQVSTPLDLPESSPRAEMTGPGLTGV